MKLFPFAAVCGTAFICLSISPLVLAENADSLDAIVVTADRKARTVDETLTPVTIITRKDIEKYQATELVDVLQRVPGINIKNDGGMGKNTSVYLRGTNASHLLVLVDGVKIGSVTSTGIPFQHIPLEQVERIEVVRGPRSSLYGSEAIGGVIQIFTRKGHNGFRPQASVGVGSHHTQNANVNLSGGDGRSWYNLNAGTEKTDGINVTANNSEPDLDGYQRESITLSAGHQLSKNTKVDLNILQSRGKTAYDGYYQKSNVVEQVVSGKVEHSLGENALITAQLGHVQDKADNYGAAGVFLDTVNSQRDTVSLQADMQILSNDNVSMGIDRQKEAVKATSIYTKTSRQNTGVFASYRHTIGKSNIEVSARQDNNEQFGKHSTGALAIGRELSNGVRLKASYGTAFKTPTFDDMYYAYSDPYYTYVPNPNIQPEKSKNAEVGVSGKLPQGTWEVNVFDNQINNLIALTTDPVTFVDSVANVNQARIQGVELVAGTQLAGWRVNGNVTLQNPQDRSTHKVLVYRPRELASVDVDRNFGKWGVGTTLRGEGKRYADSANSTSLPGYATLDLRADYKLAKDWTVGAKIGNVLDKQYETNKGYNQDGINGLVTLKYAPK